MMSKEQMMQEFVSSAITPLLERVVTKKLVQTFDVIAEQQKADLAAARARIAELEAALTALAHGDGCFMEAAYKEGWSDAGSPYDWKHAESSWEESHAAGDARRAAALLNKETP